MFTYEWLARPSESGVPRVLDRSVTSTSNLQAAIADAKSVLRKENTFPTGKTKPYGVRILNSDSILVWAGNVDNT
jgi:hypothetical protein